MNAPEPASLPSDLQARIARATRAGYGLVVLELIAVALITCFPLGMATVILSVFCIGVICLVLSYFLFSFSRPNANERRPAKLTLLFALSSLASIILLFANLYRWAGLKDATQDYVVTHRLWDCIYFSIITITTVGYGDLCPATSAARLSAAAEALSGYFILGLLVASLANMLRVAK